MSKKWVDEGITTRASRTPEQRAADARAEHKEWCAALQGYPCNCSDSLGLSEQREADAKRTQHNVLRMHKKALDVLRDKLVEQSAIIIGQRAAIEALREMVEDMAQGHRHLAGRLDALAHLLDSQAKSVAERFGNVEATMGLLVDGYKQTVESLALRQELDKFKARVIAAVPSAGKPTIQKMCDDVEFRGPPEEDKG